MEKRCRNKIITIIIIITGTITTVIITHIKTITTAGLNYHHNCRYNHHNYNDHHHHPHNHHQTIVGWLVACLTSQQQANVSQGRICSDNFTCCHTEIEVADPTFYLTQSQYTDTGPTSPSADPITPGAWQGSHWSANFEVTGMTRPRKNPGASGIRTPDLPLSRRTP